MKKLMTEWRKYIKESKESSSIVKDVSSMASSSDFLKGMQISSGKRQKVFEVITAFIENSNEVNNIFEECLKLIAKYNFEITDLFRPDPSSHSKEQLEDSKKYWEFAKKMVTAIANIIKNGKEDEVAKTFNLPYNRETSFLFYTFKEDAEEVLRGLANRPKNVWNVVHFFNEVAYEISKDPKKMDKVKIGTTPQGIADYEAPQASDFEDYDYNLDYAKNIRNRETYNTEKEINENKKKF